MASSSFLHNRCTIDQLPFAAFENVYYARGTGENSVSLHFVRLKEPDGQEYWVWEQKDQTWLYQKLSVQSDVGRAAVSKVFKADSVGKKDRKEAATFSWLYLDNPLGSKHFGPCKTALKLEDREGIHYFAEIPLWKWTRTEILSAASPAEGIARSFHTKIAPEKVPNINTTAPVTLGLALFLIFGFGSFDRLGLLIPLFWILAPCAVVSQALAWLFASPKTSHSELVKFVSTLFCLHFALHGLDAAVSEHGLITGLGYNQAESISLSVTSLLLAATYRFPRAYMAVAEGAWLYGASCWGLAFMITCFRSMDDRYFYFRHFIYDTGSQPWSSFILAITLAGIIYKYFDYRRAPTSVEAFNSKLQRLARGMESPGRLARETLKLANYADDLEDAFDISRDASLLQWGSCGGDFAELRDQLLALGKARKGLLSIEQIGRIDSDLALIAADLRDLGRNITGNQHNQIAEESEQPEPKFTKSKKSAVRDHKPPLGFAGLRLSPSLQILKYSSPHRQFPFA